MLQGAAWDTSSVPKQSLPKKHEPSGHNMPLIVAVGGVLVAGAAWFAANMLRSS